MTATYVGIVVSTRQKTVRRIIVPDTDAELQQPGIVEAGETLLLMPMAIYQSLTDISQVDQWLVGEIGAGLSGRCVILDGRDIVQYIIYADPSILSETKGLPRGWTLLETDTPCVVGDKYNANTGTFS